MGVPMPPGDEEGVVSVYGADTGKRIAIVGPSSSGNGEIWLSNKNGAVLLRSDAAGLGGN